MINDNHQDSIPILSTNYPRTLEILYLFYSFIPLIYSIKIQLRHVPVIKNSPDLENSSIRCWTAEYPIMARTAHHCPENGALFFLTWIWVKHYAVFLIVYARKKRKNENQ